MKKVVQAVRVPMTAFGVMCAISGIFIMIAGDTGETSNVGVGLGFLVGGIVIAWLGAKLSSGR